MGTDQPSRVPKWVPIVGLGAIFLLCALCVGLFFLWRRVSDQRGRQVFDQRDVAFTVSPDGQHIAFVAGPGHPQIYIMNLNTRHIRRVSPKDMEARFPSFSPDGRMLLYAARKAGARSSTPYALYLYSLEQGTHRPLLRLRNRSLWGMFLPDGQHILCVQSRFQPDNTWGPIPAWFGAGYWKEEKCFLTRLDGTLLHSLPVQHIFLGRLAGRPLTPRHTWLLGFANFAYNWRDMVAGRPTIREKQLPVPAHDYSPDGRLVYIDTPPKQFRFDVWLYDLRTQRKEQLTFTGGYIHDAMFHPDGQRVLYLYGDWSKGTDPRYSLWEVDIRTKKTRQIADPSLFDDPMRWRAP